MRSTLILLCSALAVSCAARVERTFADGTVARSGEIARGLQTGTWTYRHPNGAKQSEGRYEDDERVGTWTWWYADGTKEMEGAFVDESREGAWSFWHPSGELRARGRFERGLEAGAWSFFDASGALERRGDFDEGLPALRWTFFRPDGGARAEGCFLRGVRVGAWSSTAEDGAASAVSYPMPDGVALVEERGPSDGVRRIGFVEGGVPVGRWVSFHAGGARRFECRFERGVPQGLALAWRESGEPLAQGRVERGCLTGAWQVHGAAGVETIALERPRPRGVFAGEWSAASIAEALPALSVVETWLAEMCAPAEPAPIASAPAPVPAPPDATIDAPPELPAPAQDWTQREEKALPDLVREYETGIKPAGGEYEAAKPHEPIALRQPPPEIVGQALPVTSFVTAEGDVFDLTELRGRRHVLVTVLRGFGGQVCVYCAAQTKALAKASREFAVCGTEVLVVYPGPKAGLRAFLEAYERTFGPGERPPYRLLYDADLALTKALGIQDNIAVPTSLVLDRQGIVRWAHVAQHDADRPSTRAILQALERM